ncbi:MAG TPA: DNA polymerase I [Solirubrobacteraceae bacterium]|nr:DNA polymerase I [Solirubrobacteraceae bacterium]
MSAQSTAAGGAAAAAVAEPFGADGRRLFLIDGPSLVYRAFFALPESIATSTGVPTNAIFGFASMLVKIVTDYGVCPTLVAWDAGTSGRSDLYPEYKAARRSRPDLLKQQWPAMEPLVEAFGYRNVRLEGFEADDVIASLSERALQADPPVPTMIVTGDRDVFQLIDPAGVVKVMATARGITETKIYDRQAVVDRYGIPPELIPDFYGLKGDTSDNIPGIPGIGDKTASELLQSFGGLEDVLAHVQDVKGAKRKENLVLHAEDARVSKQLATVQRDLEVELDITGEAAREPDRSKLREVFRAYELRDPLKRLEEALGDAEVAAPAPSADVTLTARLRSGTPADIARLGGDGAELALVVRAGEPAEGELFAEGPAWRFAAASGGEALAGECERPEDVAAAAGERPVIAHDAKALGLVPLGLVHDTLLGAYLLEPARRGYPFTELCEERGIASDVRDPIAAEAVMLGALADWQREQIEERGLRPLMDEIELPLVRVLREMEQLGVHLNTARLAGVAERVHTEIDELERTIFRLAGEEFLIGSPQQLGEILFERLALSRKRRGKTGFSTDARVLQAIRHEHEIVPAIERWRELSTLIKTYLDVLPSLVDERSRIHTTFLQAVAQTGRLSSTNPNMQNVPIRTELGREIRGCFEAEEGCVLISADYSQIELRVLAHAAGEDVLMEIFERGEDVHTATASRVFGVAPDAIDPGMRSKSKMINYGIVYGLSDYGLADRLNIPREEAKEFIDAYLERFPQVARFMVETVERAREEGYVKTLWGRRRQIPELRARNYQTRTLGERLAVNTVIQGTAADIIKLAMVRTHEALAASKLSTRLLLTIHDELLFEGPPGEAQEAQSLIEREMVAVWEPREPPLGVDIGHGRSWLEAK